MQFLFHVVQILNKKIRFVYMYVLWKYQLRLLVCDIRVVGWGLWTYTSASLNTFEHYWWSDMDSISNKVLYSLYSENLFLKKKLFLLLTF